jgi:hypothetical protein
MYLPTGVYEKVEKAICAADKTALTEHLCYQGKPHLS